MTVFVEFQTGQPYPMPLAVRALATSAMPTEGANAWASAAVKATTRRRISAGDAGALAVRRYGRALEKLADS